eukprot:symbB.v1.2.021059.t1/scaffold1799.1/size100815/4
MGLGHDSRHSEIGDATCFPLRHFALDDVSLYGAVAIDGTVYSKVFRTKSPSSNPPRERLAEHVVECGP